MTANGALTRRRVLQGAAGLTAAAAVRPAVAQSDEPEYGSWFDNVGNYDGTTVDETGSGEVQITVGAEGNGGAFAFDPPAVEVDPGTTVAWEWTGEGGSHNVVAEDGSFESELTDEAGHTFEHAFEESGVYKYACSPHQSMGMKGAVFVSQSGGGDGGSGEDSASGGDAASEGGGPTISPTTGAVGVSFLLAFLSPLGLAALLKRKQAAEQNRPRQPRAGDYSNN